MGKEEMHLQENTFYDLDLVVKVTKMLSSALQIIWPMHLPTSNSLGEDGFTRK